MNRKVLVLGFAPFLIGALAASSAEGTAKEALAGLLPQWTAAWNKSDVAALMAMHHPDCKMAREYRASPEKKANLEKELNGIIAIFGEAKAATIGKYIERKDRYVVKIEYAKKGLIPGTMAVKQDADGKWRISDFNLDGQSEPELKE